MPTDYWTWVCDSWTVAQKDLRSLSTVISPFFKQPITWLLGALVSLLVVLWLAAPMDAPSWLSRLWLLLPMPLGIMASALLIAGEYEHHTLEPLLATRLAPHAILTGKYVAVTLFAWLITLNVVAVALLLSHGASISAPPASALFTVIMLLGNSLLSAAFSAGVGILLALHTKTVRSALIRLTLCVGILTLLAVTSLYAAPVAFPAVAEFVLPNIESLLLSSTGLGVVLWLVVDLALYGFALCRFQRDALILHQS